MLRKTAFSTTKSGSVFQAFSFVFSLFFFIFNLEFKKLMHGVKNNVILLVWGT